MSDDLFARFMEFDRYQEREHYIRAPFGWPGGKWHSLKEIIPRIPQGKTFIDACGGSGIITINSPDWFQQKVFNDRHAGVVAFYRCLSDPAKYQKLIDRLELTVHAREEFIWCKESWKNCQDDIERAARWYYMVKVSFACLGRNFGRATKGVNSITKKYKNSLELFSVIHERFKDVLVENQDVLQVLQDFDSYDAVFYVDPDYIGTNPIYEHTVDHKRLLDRIFECKGWVALSGYANPLYDSRAWDQRFEWNVVVTLNAGVFNEENGLKGKENVMSGNQKATETLWIKDFSS